MKHKKIAAFALTAVLACSAAAALSGCKGVYHDVSTLEELYAMQSGKSYRLTCDLDLQGRAWKPLAIKSFDGAGHTISNAAIRDSYTVNDRVVYQGFFSTVATLENVTFDGVQLSCTDAGTPTFVYVGFAAACADSVKNVTVKNSYGDVYTQNGTLETGCVVGRVSENKNASVNNCRAENCEVNSFKRGIMGGIIGESYVSIYNCVADGVKLVSDGTLGGIVGNQRILTDSIDLEIADCAARNCEFVADEGTVGGLVGAKRSSAASGCVAENNTFTLGGGEFYAGGLIAYNTSGEIRNCLSRNNKIVSSATGSANESNFGGFAGITGGAIRSCIAYGNTIDCRDEVSVGAGFCPALAATVSYCAAEGIFWYADNSHGLAFSPVSNKVVSCWTYNATPPEGLDAQTVNKEDFTSPAWLIENCKLDSAIWTLAEGSLPEIKIL